MAGYSPALAAYFAPRTRLYGAIGAAAEPTPELSVAEWAEKRRYVSEDAGSPQPGKWSNATTPYAVEMMECLSPDHPADTVTLKCASQLVKTEVGLNWIGQTIDVDPAPFLVVQPSLSEAQLFSTTKFEPMVSATPTLKSKVFELIERSRTGSTTKTKRYRGGPLHIVSAGASKDLQAKSVKRVFADEISEYGEDSGERGDPLAQAITRTDAHADRKILLASTPGELPGCRISSYYEKGDQRQFYCPCPECGAFQTLDFDRLKRTGEGAAFACAECGVLIDERHKKPMLAAGVWIKTYESEADPLGNPAPPACFEASELEHWRGRSTEGRQPSFHLSQVYSPFKPWARLLDEADAAQKDPAQRKTFRQQKLGLAWDPAVDAPDFEALYKARGEHVQRGVVPAWACLLTGAADVQNNRIEWAVYAWGPDKSGARIDCGVCEGDTSTDAPWLELAEMIKRRWPGEATQPLGLDAFGVDSGGGAGRTAKVYEFVKRSIGLKALKGASKFDALPFGEGGIGRVKGRNGKYVTAKIHLVGGWGVKKTIYAMAFRALQASEAGERLPYGLYFPFDAPEEHFKQLTAEVFKEPKSRRAGAVGFWEKISGRSNEQLDLAVYCYALAWDKGLERWGPTEWAKLFAARAAPSGDAPLLDYAAREAAEQGAQAIPRHAAKEQPAAAPAVPSQDAGAQLFPAVRAVAPTTDTTQDAPVSSEREAAHPAPPPPPAGRLAKNPSASDGALPAWMQRLAAHNKTNQRKPSE
ncbi:MAG TPA: terminase gpA endonuclease subunit [Vitreimonas sp.]|uniref:phage terminase large subunit family protein n=1 Tax=Vitreimonas sp. TaxID=3069702 RepID=UPI002D250D97|nr:terminase gpA endonuclease subunit [Vitreimonas sp.]HYD87123.1 terminase gpA endonuclease subunit [Vitreimonas sp.]